jgi:hypothetical protein
VGKNQIMINIGDLYVSHFGIALVCEIMLVKVDNFVAFYVKYIHYKPNNNVTFGGTNCYVLSTDLFPNHWYKCNT